MRTTFSSLLKKMRVFSLYRKLVLSFITISVIFVAAFSWMVYTAFSHTLQREYEYMAHSTLNKADTALTTFYDNVCSLSYNVLSLPQVDSILYRSGIDRLSEYRAFLEFRNLQNAYPYILSITLIDVADDRFISTSGVGNHYDLSDWSDQLGGTTAQRMFVKRRSKPRNYNITRSPMVDVVSFLYKPSGMLLPGLIVLDVDTAVIESMIHFGSDDAMDLTFIMDDAGNLITGDRSILDLGVNWESILRSEPLNQVDWTHGSDTYLINRISTAMPDWSIVRVMPYETNTSVGASFLGNLLWIVLGLIIVDAVVTAILVSRLYKPIGSLVSSVSPPTGLELVAKTQVDELKMIHGVLWENLNRIELLEAYQDRATSFLKQQCVRFILLGEHDAVNELWLLSSQNAVAWEKGHFAAVCFSIDQQADYVQRFDEKERSLHGFYMSNICEQLLESVLVQSLVRMDEDTFGALLFFPHALPNDTLPALKEVQWYMLKHFAVSVSVSVGCVVPSWKEAAISYQGALASMEDRFFTGPQSLLNASKRIALKNPPEYPFRLVPKVTEAIVLKDAKKARALVGTFIDMISSCEAQYVRSHSEHFVNDVFHDLAHRGIPMSQEKELHAQIQNAEYISGLQAALEACMDRLVNEVQDKDEKSGETGNVMVYAREYILEHFNDSNLSVESMASLVGLSPAYFGKLFSNTFSESCNNYIADVRMEKAAQLLRETNQTVRNISEAVGLTAPNYFFLLFKKKFGMTPMEYRKAHKDNLYSDGGMKDE